MGFHKDGSPDTRYLLRQRCIIPMHFADGKMTLHPDKPVVDSRRKNKKMWVVREIAPINTLAVGYCDFNEIDIYFGTVLVKSIVVSGRIFGIVVVPNTTMESIKLKPISVKPDSPKRSLTQIQCGKIVPGYNPRTHMVEYEESEEEDAFAAAQQDYVEKSSDEEMKEEGIQKSAIMKGGLSIKLAKPAVSAGDFDVDLNTLKTS